MKRSTQWFIGLVGLTAALLISWQWHPSLWQPAAHAQAPTPASPRGRSAGAVRGARRGPYRHHRVAVGSHLLRPATCLPPVTARHDPRPPALCPIRPRVQPRPPALSRTPPRPPKPWNQRLPRRCRWPRPPIKNQPKGFNWV